MEYLSQKELITIMIIGFAIFIIPLIFFLITQQNTLKAIQVKNRLMSPGEVWLQLIPLFGIVWQFFVVSRIAGSISRELASDNTFSFEEQQNTDRNQSNIKPTYNIGIAYCVLTVCSIIPVLGGITAIAGLVCWIIYWVKLSEYKNQLQNRILNMTPSSTTL